MRNLIYLVFLLLLSSSPLLAQKSIEQSLQFLAENDVSSFSKNFEDYVTLTINNEPVTYSQAQARGVLSHFFKEHTISSISIENRSNPDSRNKIYVIARIKISTESDLLIYLLYHLKNNQYLIEEIRLTQ